MHIHVYVYIYLPQPFLQAYLSTQLESERQKLVVAEAELTRMEGRLAEMKAEKDSM